MISPQLAGQILTEITQHSPVPAAPAGLTRYTFQANDHVMIGDTAVRGYKHKSQWRLVEKDIRRAAHNLAALVIDTDDLTAVTVPPQYDRMGAVPGDGLRWRWRILDGVETALYREHEARACACIGGECRGPRSKETGLPQGIVWDELLQSHAKLVIASTRPLPLLSWSPEQGWMLPRAYADMLDRAEQVEAALSQRADVCSGCGAVGDRWRWRTSSKAGFQTQCPSCATATYRPYTGHLQGRRYTTLSSRYQADEYLCCLCPEPRRAYYWDHCHEHDLVRGPTCASCNTAEGGGSRFTRYLDGAGLRHLMRCDGCRNERTVPPRHQADVIRHEVKPEPHEGCTATPALAFCMTESDGSVSMHLSCWHAPSLVQWTQVVPATRVHQIVHAYVERFTSPEDGCGGDPSAP